jgi:hypothetical protein
MSGSGCRQPTPAGGEAQAAEIEFKTGGWSSAHRRDRGALGATVAQLGPPRVRDQPIGPGPCSPITDHRDHTQIELTIRDLKYRALAHFPSGQMHANGAWTVIAALVSADRVPHPSCCASR